MRVFLDVLAAVPDLGAHELAHGAVGDHGVLDGHALQDARLGVHGGARQLLGVHLAQALVALDGIALALLGDLAVGLLVIALIRVQAERLDGIAQNLVLRLAAVGVHVVDLVATLMPKIGGQATYT